MATADIADGLGGTLSGVQLPAAPGRVAAASSKSVVLSTEDKTALDAVVTALQLLDNAVSGNEIQVDVLTMPTVAVTGTFYQATQPVSIATVPSHAVTNAGTFAVQNTAALAAGTALIGKVDHASTGIGHGVKTVTTAGTDVVLASSTAAKWVTVQAQTGNIGWVAVGATGVDATEATGNGVLLAAGESITLPVDNLADVFIDATTNGEGVRFTYGT